MEGNDEDESYSLYGNKHEDEDEDMSSSSSSTSERSDQSTMCASTPHNILYEEEDIEVGDQGDVTPPPLYLVEARLLQLMMKYSISLGSYIYFWNGQN
eukprot:scaffold28661_cov68-Attheya_sp.AAC.2